MLFNEKVLEVALSQIGLNIGWQSMSQQSMRILQTLIMKYIQEIGKATMGYANNFNRSEPIFADALLALRQMNINVEEIQEYMRKVEMVPFIKAGSIPKYPFPPVRGYARITFPTQDEIATRPEYIEEWLPSLNFGEKSTDEKAALNGDHTMIEINGLDETEDGQLLKTEDLLNGNVIANISGDAKKDDFRPENLNDHIYLSSVYIDAEGRVVGIGGREGVAPDSKLPPRDDYEERRLAEEEARKRKKEDEENEKQKKKQKTIGEDTSKLKLKFKDKPGARGRKLEPNRKRSNLSAKKENIKKKSPQTLSIKFSGLRSDSPSAMPSPSFSSLSPSTLSMKDSTHGRDSYNEQTKLTSEEERNYDNCINAVVERSRKAVDSDLDDRESDLEMKLFLEVETPKAKKMRKDKVAKNKKKLGYDETIEDVIKFAMNNGESDLPDESDRQSVFNFSEDNESEFNAKEEVTAVDAKEAAKILVSLSEDSSKKPKKLNARKVPKTPSPSPLSPPPSFFNESINDSQLFSKASSTSTPLSPSSNPQMFGSFPSQVKSASMVSSGSLFSKGDPFSSGSLSFNSNLSTPPPSTPSLVPVPSENNPDYKPPLKTLAAKKVLPPINENLLLKKEKKEKKKRDSSEKEKDRADKFKEKDKGKEVDHNKKHENKEMKKNKKPKTSSDGSRSGEIFKEEVSSKPSTLKSVNSCRSPSSTDIPSPSSSTSSTKLVIRTPATPLTATEKEIRRSSKKKTRKMSVNSVSNDPVKPGKPSSKERNKDKARSREDRKGKERSEKGDASCVLITETVSKAEKGREKEDEWICPVCKIPYDGVNNMIGCDGCDDWYHWTCVGVTEDPGEEESWFCTRCIQKQKSIENKVIKKSSSSASSTAIIDHSSNHKDWSCPVCRFTNPKGESDTMIECDACDEWYHYSCVNISQDPPTDEPWYCPTCTPVKVKKRIKHSKPGRSSSKPERSDKKESKNNSSSWICLVCRKSSNSKPTICCDSCDQWFHWPCVGIVIPPKDTESWFCATCLKMQAKHH